MKRWRINRILIALLILLLILLPIYLWPFRAGSDGGPGAAGRAGSVRDPRDPAALAGIPSDVWDRLMGRARAVGNLTMITSLQSGDGSESLTSPAGDLEFPQIELLLGRQLSPLSGGQPDASGDGPGGEGPLSNPVLFLAGVNSGDPGTGLGGGGFRPGGGQGGAPILGPIVRGGGPGGGGGLEPSDLGTPSPTPEPSTLLLVGSNLAAIGAMAWRQRKRKRESISESVGTRPEAFR